MTQPPSPRTRRRLQALPRCVGAAAARWGPSHSWQSSTARRRRDCEPRAAAGVSVATRTLARSTWMRSRGGSSRSTAAWRHMAGLKISSAKLLVGCSRRVTSPDCHSRGMAAGGTAQRSCAAHARVRARRPLLHRSAGPLPAASLRCAAPLPGRRAACALVLQQGRASGTDTCCRKVAPARAHLLTLPALLYLLRRGAQLHVPHGICGSTATHHPSSLGRLLAAAPGGPEVRACAAAGPYQPSQLSTLFAHAAADASRCCHPTLHVAAAPGRPGRPPASAPLKVRASVLLDELAWKSPQNKIADRGFHGPSPRRHSPHAA